MSSIVKHLKSHKYNLHTFGELMTEVENDYRRAHR